MEKSNYVTGVLQKFVVSSGFCHVFVRVKGHLIHFDVSNRGVLEQEGIRDCRDLDERYKPIDPDTEIILFVEVSGKGKACLDKWAEVPKISKKSSRSNRR